jgi:hypothetical protein
MRFLFLVICLAVALFVASREPAPTEAQVVGSYTGRLNGALETIALRDDGIFRQDVTLPNGQRVTSDGKWTLQHKAITLDRYTCFYSAEKEGALTEPRELRLFVYSWGANTLIHDWETGCYTLKKM